MPVRGLFLIIFGSGRICSEVPGQQKFSIMKRFLFGFLTVLLFSVVPANGQAALLVLIFGDKVATENFHFSLKLGVSYSIIHGYEEGDNAFSLNFGLVNNIKLTDRLTLMPEFLPLSVRAVKNIPVLTTGNPDLDRLLVEVESSDRRLHYIDIPVLLNYKITDRFSISAGPQLSILTQAMDTYMSEPVENVVLKSEVDIISSVKRFDIGAVIDLQYILVPPVGGKGINLFVRYGKGFVGIHKGTEGPRYTSSMIQFGATFPFVEKTEGAK